MDTLLAGSIARDADQPLGVQRTDRRLGVEVEQHHPERRRVDALVAHRCHITQHQRRQDASGAEPGKIYFLTLHTASTASRIDLT